MELITRLLAEAVQGETFAEKRYRIFSDHAASEGCAGIATLFHGLADAEKIHIVNHERALEKNNGSPSDITGIGHIHPETVQDNIALAIAGEREEISSMYPSFIKQIKKRYGRDFTARIALLSLSWALEAEEGHLELLQWAAQKVARDLEPSPDNFYLCSVCGNLVHREKPPRSICPVCGHDSHFYRKVHI